MSTVLVGVDGSPGAETALRWALGEARLRGATLHVVYVWRLPLYATAPEPAFAGAPPFHGALDEEFGEAMASEAQEVLNRCIAGIEREAEELGVEVRAEAIRGNPSHVLVGLAGDADLLVVGSRGRGGFKGLLLGSVSQQCVQHSPCPTVVVRIPRQG